MRLQHNDLGLNYIEYVPSGRNDKGLPLVIVLHGRGADSNDLADLALPLDGGYRFLFPDAPKPFEIMRGYSQGYTWFDGWPATPDSIQASRRTLLEFVSEAMEKYEVTASKTVMGGFSQGGLMSIDVGYRTPSPLAGIVCLSGATYEVEMPDFASRKSMPVLVAHGTEDDVIPVLAAQRTRQLMMNAGINPEYYEFDMGHWIVPEEVEAVRAFLAKCLG